MPLETRPIWVVERREGGGLVLTSASGDRQEVPAEMVQALAEDFAAVARHLDSVARAMRQAV